MPPLTRQEGPQLVLQPLARREVPQSVAQPPTRRGGLPLLGEPLLWEPQPWQPQPGEPQPGELRAQQGVPRGFCFGVEAIVLEGAGCAGDLAAMLQDAPVRPVPLRCKRVRPEILGVRWWNPPAFGLGKGSALFLFVRWPRCKVLPALLSRWWLLTYPGKRAFGGDLREFLEVFFEKEFAQLGEPQPDVEQLVVQPPTRRKLGGPLLGEPPLGEPGEPQPEVEQLVVQPPTRRMKKEVWVEHEDVTVAMPQGTSWLSPVQLCRLGPGSAGFLACAISGAFSSGVSSRVSFVDCADTEMTRRVALAALLEGSHLWKALELLQSVVQPLTRLDEPLPQQLAVVPQFGEPQQPQRGGPQPGEPQQGDEPQLGSPQRREEEATRVEAVTALDGREHMRTRWGWDGDLEFSSEGSVPLL